MIEEVADSTAEETVEAPSARSSSASARAEPTNEAVDSNAEASAAVIRILREVEKRVATS
jgi:hypothetical protein